MNKSKIDFANKILTLVEILLEENNVDTTKCSVEFYQNGRESGYSIFKFPDTGETYQVFQIVFGNDRNSDTIVVYTGTSSNFLPGGNIPRDDAWANRRFFGTYSEAAQFIVESLMDW